MEFVQHVVRFIILHFAFLTSKEAGGNGDNPKASTVVIAKAKAMEKFQVQLLPSASTR